jgi:carbamoyl-phosphate synthase large subunit
VVGEVVLARRLIRSLLRTPIESLEIKPWKHYLSQAVRERSIRLFIRQPFTETSEREAVVIQGVVDVLREINGTPHQFQFLTSPQAQNSRTFRLHFEKETGQAFTPQNFRRNRLQLLDQADAIVVIRTGLSESTAFELAYNIFGRTPAPIFFAIWDQAPIKTTLLRDLNEIVPVRYVTFSNPAELTRPLLDFFETCAMKNGTHSTEYEQRVELRKMPWHKRAMVAS